MAVHFFFQVSPTSSLPPFLSFLFFDRDQRGQRGPSNGALAELALRCLTLISGLRSALSYTHYQSIVSIVLQISFFVSCLETNIFDFLLMSAAYKPLKSQRTIVDIAFVHKEAWRLAKSWQNTLMYISRSQTKKPSEYCSTKTTTKIASKICHCDSEMHHKTKVFCIWQCEIGQLIQPNNQVEHHGTIFDREQSSITVLEVFQLGMRFLRQLI